MKRAAFGHKMARFSGPDREQRVEARAARMAALARSHVAVPPLVRAVMQRAPQVAQPVPKTVERRNAHLLAMAKGMPCLLRIPGVCERWTATTVACHSNSHKHGKAGARKADDHYTVWGCASCHRWLDQPIGHDGPTMEQKQSAFERAHREQRVQWADIAYDPYDMKQHKPKDRKAARWALDQYIADNFDAKGNPR